MQIDKLCRNRTLFRKQIGLCVMHVPIISRFSTAGAYPLCKYAVGVIPV